VQETLARSEPYTPYLISSKKNGKVLEILVSCKCKEFRRGSVPNAVHAIRYVCKNFIHKLLTQNLLTPKPAMHNKNYNTSYENRKQQLEIRRLYARNIAL